MSRRVVVTGIGITCCLGETKEEVIYSLDNDICGLKKQDYLNIECLKDLYFGKSKNEDILLENCEDLEKTEYMAIKTIHQALNDSHIEKEYIDKWDDRVGLSLSSSLVGIDHIIKSAEVDQNKGEWLIYSRRFANYIMEQIGIKGTCYTTSSACAAGTAGVGIAFDLVRDNDLDVAIVGGVDELSLFSIFGFYALRNLSKGICKPFDNERDGINLGEGACFLILEELEHAIARETTIYGEILGYGIANDAYHMTAPDPNGYGASLAINMARENVNIDENSRIYINAHGTATKANDAMELDIITKEFGEDNVFVSSTKSRTGHCLGAAGSIELAISLLSVKNKKAYATINSNLNMLENTKIIQNRDKNQKFQYAMSNSYAFGGHAASILIAELKGV